MAKKFEFTKENIIEAIRAFQRSHGFLLPSQASGKITDDCELKGASWENIHKALRTGSVEGVGSRINTFGKFKKQYKDEFLTNPDSNIKQDQTPRVKNFSAIKIEQAVRNHIADNQGESPTKSSGYFTYGDPADDSVEQHQRSWMSTFSAFRKKRVPGFNDVSFSGFKKRLGVSSPRYKNTLKKRLNATEIFNALASIKQGDVFTSLEKNEKTEILEGVTLEQIAYAFQTASVEGIDELAERLGISDAGFTQEQCNSHRMLYSDFVVATGLANRNNETYQLTPCKDAPEPLSAAA